ncbi:hypothetical protein N7462_007511 [Penicillium macrosclerotiorum]|uniref:uncharacterized protein n=1 Tax=Penicillium macrosclerotiorum TaxID=303699 RepID=UPI0025484FD5|nr:uncharacterized protein N7462_007511 [Penicillium macrosclerotiorum]KAJ5679267.1 hypothetical protein N7462_007511 [Penicillium macrosclerotiorum]
MAALKEQLKTLVKNYTACDVSDALLKLQKVPEGVAPRAGFLADLTPFSPILGRNDTAPKIAAPATTFKFLSKSANSPAIATENPEKHGFPPGKHWVDYAGNFAAADPSQTGSIIVIEQPEDQYCAVTGGIMATRMKALGIKAAVVGGRVRDLRELQATELPIWARGTSTVGTGAEAKAVVRDVPISLEGVTVSPGDIIFCDPMEGVVAIPRDLLDPVLELMPKLINMDDQAKEAVTQGMTVTEAFKKFRT